jgi:hypothetical protein
MLKTGVALLVALIAAGAYYLYPYWTLINLQDAIRNKDTTALEALIDWPQVRAALKSDLRAGITAAQPTASNAEAAGAALGTVLGAAYLDTLVDGYVSAAGMTQRIDPDAALGLIGKRGFVSPTMFFIDCDIPRDAPPAYKITILMQLSGLSWRVVRILVPWEALKTTDSESAVLRRLRKP